MITRQELTEALRYDPDTGIFSWRHDRLAGDGALRRPAGSSAGGHMSNGYILITLYGRQYLAHRLAWLHTYGSMPNGIIDHIDGDRSNNRIVNLRPCTKSQNSANSKNQRIGKLKGAYYRADRDKWRAAITYKGKSVHLGTFDTELSAHEAYMIAAKKYFGEFARAA